MAGAIMRPLTSDLHMQSRWVDGRKMNRVAGDLMKPNDRLTSFERLEIYNRQYWFRLLDCFSQDFPGLRATLGDHKFEKMAERYLACYPSQSFTLRNLGSQIERFLREEPHWTSPHEKLALDLARFEWAQVVAFDGEARPVLTPQKFLGKKPSRLSLKLQPYLSLLELDYPVDEWMIALKRKKEESLRSEASNAVETRPKKPSPPPKVGLPKPKKVFVAVHRVNHSLYYKRLEPEAYQILVSLQKGDALEEACEKAFTAKHFTKKNPSAQVQKWFQNWMSLGWFCEEKRLKVKGNMRESFCTL